MKALLVVVLFTCPLLAQNYTLPNNNAGCPSNCRQIPWVTGSDLWNGGVLPVYTSVSCNGIIANGSTDQTTNIQNCINVAGANTAVLLPATGVPPSNCIFINGTLRLVSNVVLRGASTGSGSWICEGANGYISTQNFSHSTHLNPATTFNQIPPTFTLSGSPTKGNTTVTCASGCANVSVGTWIKIFGNDDPSLVLSLNGDCDYCGDDTGAYLMQQIVQVTGIAGSVFTLSQPLYYTPFAGAVTLTDPVGTEPTGIKFNIITFPTQKAGFEYLHIVATGDIGANPIIDIQGCLFCWIKGVETQFSGSNSNGDHVRFQWTYGNEIRESYLHEQRSGASGSGYGIWSEWVNGNLKVENNIVRHNRHGIIWEGGGGGDFVGYNYSDDEYTDDLTYLGSTRPNHGSHPYMQLWEGNIISHSADDDLHGSSSHLVRFRNSFWGDETNDNGGCFYNSGTGVTPAAATCSVVPSFTANLATHSILGFAAIDIFDMNSYMSFVANVLGRTTLHANWANATLRADSGSCCIGTDNAPYVYAISTLAVGTIPNPNSTVLLHGNYDFKTNGVAFFDGGANHNFGPSWYYTSKPSFVGSKPWPMIGPDVTGGNLSGTAGLVNTNPAYDCYWNTLHGNQLFNGATCFAVSGSPSPPSVLSGAGVWSGTSVIK